MRNLIPDENLFLSWGHRILMKFCFEALESTKISSYEPVSGQKYENGCRTKICNFTVFDVSPMGFIRNATEMWQSHSWWSQLAKRRIFSCLGSMVHLEFFLTTLCLVSSGFLANLFLKSFCIQNRLRGNHCLRSPSFRTVCTVCPLRKWRRWYEEAKREKRLRNEQAPN